MGNKPRPKRESGARMMLCAELDNASHKVFCSIVVYSTERFIRFKTYSIGQGEMNIYDATVQAISNALHIVRADVPYYAFVYSPTLGFHDDYMILCDIDKLDLSEDVAEFARKRFKFYGVPVDHHTVITRGVGAIKHYAIRDILYEANANLMSGNEKATQGITARLRNICSSWDYNRSTVLKNASCEVDKIIADNTIFIDSTRCLYSIVWEGPTGSKVAFASQDRRLVEEEYKRLLKWFDVTGKGFRGVLKWLKDNHHLAKPNNMIYMARQFGIELQAVKEFCRLSRNGKYDRFHMDVIPYITSRKDGKDKEVFINIEEETDASRSRHIDNRRKIL